MLIEEEGQRHYMGFPGRVRMRSLLDGRYRLSLYDGAGWGELYDRASDPEELNNLWNEPGARALRSEMAEKLAQSMIAHSGISPYPTHIA